MRRVSISAAWDETKAIIARDGKLLAAVALALVALPQAIMAVVGLPVGPEAKPISSLMYFVVILIGLAAQVALNRLAIGPSTTVGGAIGRGFARLLPLFAAFVLFGIVLVLILMLIAIPLAGAGLIRIPAPGQPPSPSLILIMLALLAVGFAIFQLSIPVAAVEAGGPIRLLRRSWELSRGAYLRLLAFVLFVFTGVVVLGLAVRSVAGSLIILALGTPTAGTMSALLLGLIAGVVQAAFTVVSAVMLARIYGQLAGRGETESGVPITGI
jgi:hypothetical protein